MTAATRTRLAAASLGLPAVAAVWAWLRLSAAAASADAAAEKLAECRRLAGRIAALRADAPRAAAEAETADARRGCMRRGTPHTLGSRRRAAVEEIEQWPRRDSNPYDPFGPRDFKSLASANSATRPWPVHASRRGGAGQRGGVAPLVGPMSGDASRPALRAGVPPGGRGYAVWPPPSTDTVEKRTVRGCGTVRGGAGGLRSVGLHAGGAG